jgi:hypothetical protein
VARDQFSVTQGEEFCRCRNGANLKVEASINRGDQGSVTLS